MWACPVRTEGDKSTTECIVGRISVRESQGSPVSVAMVTDTSSAAAIGQMLWYEDFIQQP